MPHQCVKCGAFYEDGSDVIIKGCTSKSGKKVCGGKLFFYVKKEKLEALKEEQNDVQKLSKKDKEQIEKDVYDLIGDDIDKDKPIILDIESIKILKPGKYELDLVHLFEAKQPLIYKLEDGKYMVDLIETFKKLKNQ